MSPELALISVDMPGKTVHQTVMHEADGGRLSASSQPEPSLHQVGMDHSWTSAPSHEVSCRLRALATVLP